MTNPVPSLEARVSAQERQMIVLQACIEEVNVNMTARFTELSRDFQASFKQLAEYQIATESKLDARFEAIDARFDAVDKRFEAVDARFDAVDKRFDAMDARFDAMDARVDRIESRMATKEDLASLESRILDTLKQFISAIDTRLLPQQ